MPRPSNCLIGLWLILVVLRADCRLFEQTSHCLRNIMSGFWKQTDHTCPSRLEPGKFQSPHFYTKHIIQNKNHAIKCSGRLSVWTRAQFQSWYEKLKYHDIGEGIYLGTIPLEHLGYLCEFYKRPKLKMFKFIYLDIRKCAYADGNEHTCIFTAYPKKRGHLPLSPSASPSNSSSASSSSSPSSSPHRHFKSPSSSPPTHCSKHKYHS